jgi:hypothetical protein
VQVALFASVFLLLISLARNVLVSTGLCCCLQAGADAGSGLGSGLAGCCCCCASFFCCGGSNDDDEEKQNKKKKKETELKAKKNGTSV